MCRRQYSVALRGGSLEKLPVLQWTSRVPAATTPGDLGQEIRALTNVLHGLHLRSRHAAVVFGSLQTSGHCHGPVWCHW